jgi:hypothetical protein
MINIRIVFTAVFVLILAAVFFANAQIGPPIGGGGGGGTPCTIIATSLQYNNSGAFGCAPFQVDATNLVFSPQTSATSTTTFTGARVTMQGDAGVMLFGRADADIRMVGLGQPNGTYNGVVVGSDGAHAWGSNTHVEGGNAAATAALTRPASWTIQEGMADAAAPNAQAFQAQSVVAGTSNTAGANWTFGGSRSTGSGTSGDIIFQTGGTGAGATVQNAFVTALTVKGATQLVQLNAITTDATHTDATVCEDTTTHALYFGSGTLGVCLGTSSARFKNRIADQSDGMAQIVGLQPKNFYYNPGYGDGGDREQYGFLAEDVVSVLPKLVGMDADGKPNSVDLIGMIPIMVKAIQEQQKIIRLQDERIKNLEHH